jgi:hypothetical protein
MPRVRNRKNWRSHLQPWKPEKTGKPRRKREAYPPSPAPRDLFRDRSGRERFVLSNEFGRTHIVYRDPKLGSLHSVTWVEWLRWVDRHDAEIVSPPERVGLPQRVIAEVRRRSPHPQQPTPVPMIPGGVVTLSRHTRRDIAPWQLDESPE